MEKTNIAFWGSGSFALEFFKTIESEDSIAINYIVTQPDRPKGRGYLLSSNEFSNYLRNRNYPVFTPSKIDDPFIDTISGWDVQVHVVASYGQIIPKQLLDKYPDRFINIHPSLLPKYRGASPVSATILHGDLTTGVTIMLMDQGVDTGKIISQEKTAISKTVSKDVLQYDLAVMGGQLLIKTLPAYLSGQISPNPQSDQKLPTTKKIIKADGLISWDSKATEIDRHFRAFQPWPGIWTMFHNKSLKLADISLSELSNTDIAPGTVWKSQDSKILVQTGQGSIELLKIQLAGKNIQPVGDFLNGHQDFIGSILAG